MLYTGREQRLRRYIGDFEMGDGYIMVHLPNINGLRWRIMGKNMIPGIISLCGVGMLRKMGQILGI